MNISNNTLYYEHDDRTPLTRLSIIFSGAGEQKEKEETAGLANIVAKLLLRGTASYSREEIELKFDLLGATVSAMASENDFVIRVLCFSRNLSQVTQLLYHIIEHADFPQSELEIAFKEEKAKFASTLQSNEEVLRYAHRYVLFGKKYHGKIGSKLALANIDRKLVTEFYRNVAAASVVYCTAVSDLSESELQNCLTPFLYGRGKNGFVLEPEAAYRIPERKEVVIVDSPNAPNDRLLWSHIGIGAMDPRRFSLALVLDALGSFEGFLFDQLRNKNGWCYGMYAYQVPPTERKSLIAYYSDPADTTSAMLIPKLLELLETFYTAEDFLSRLSERNSSFKNRFAYQQDLNYKINSRINRDKYGVPILNQEEYFAEIDAATIEFSLRTIKEIFTLRKLMMVFYGDSKRITSIVSAIDPSIPISTFDKSELIA